VPTIYPLARPVFTPLPTMAFVDGPWVDLLALNLAVQFAEVPLLQFDFSPYEGSIVQLDNFQILDSDGNVLSGADGEILWGVDQ
jgi:hypothetical protein